MPVEDLAIGDLVVTEAGAHRPIRWLGHRSVACRLHPRPHETHPIRISAHAFGENRPARDLFVSPAHAICVDVVGEVLIPASSLVNGATVVQVEVDAITYWHVELESHDIILAENLPAESYLDMGNRGFFAEGGVVALDASPDADAASHTHADFCRPFHRAGVLVEGVRAQMRRRAGDLGWALAAASASDDLWLEIDGARVDLPRDGLVASAVLPSAAREVMLCSTIAVPRLTTGDADMRRLGVSIAAVSVDDGLDYRREIGCGDARLTDGFHSDEGSYRWTDGRARLPAELWAGVAADFVLRITLAEPRLPTWVAPGGVRLTAEIQAA